jgi:phenylpropionate dioxygenase-like ring-hydroxylating dioxygenase large terminal subunit
MPESLVTDDAVRKLVDSGLRNLWYPVAPSWQVRADPIGITRLGERMALWRDADGGVHALRDRCPHRGARLSLGWNLGDRLACWYHGVQVDAAGRVVDVPAVEQCPMKGEIRVKSYPVRESNGAIFAYFGDELHAEPPEPRLPEQLTSDDFSGFLCTAFWRCNYRYALDNVMDPMHGTYLHAVSHSMAEGEKSARMRVRKTDHGLIFEKETQRDVNFDWVEFGNTGCLWMRLTIPYRKNAGPGGSFWIVGFVTPVTHSICQVYFWRMRGVQGWQRDLWRFLYKNRLEGRHWAVLEQDRIILENLAPDARDHEFLYQHDTGMARVRRILENEARSQLAALAGASLQAAE